MSEVKRYHLTEDGLIEGNDPGRLNVVLAADHDRITAERNALQQRLNAATENWDFAQDRQQRLAKADERAGVLEGLLREVVDSGGLICFDYDATAETIDLHERIEVELKPAEGRRSVPVNDYWEKWFMSLMENVYSAYGAEDGRRVEAIAKTLMSEFFGREFTEAASGRITLRAMARKGEPRSMKCVEVAGVLVNYMREELE